MKPLPILNDHHVLMFNDGRGNPRTRPDGSPLHPGDLFISRAGDQVTTVIRDEHGRLTWTTVKEVGLNEEQIALVRQKYPDAFGPGARVNFPDGIRTPRPNRKGIDRYACITPELWTNPEAWKAKNPS